jgi:pilus assembly protein CpaB
MRRRLLATAAALVLALVGAVVLLAYAKGADARAMAGQRTQQVLVTAQRIPSGTAATALGGLVQTRRLPATAVAPGAVTDLAALTGKVTTVDLLPGEQLLAGRFTDPSQLRAPGTVAVPPGLQEVTVQLDPERALGGRLAAGDHVGVFVSLVNSDGSGSTDSVLHTVLVTQVQGGTAPPPAAGGTAAASATAGPSAAAASSSAHTPTTTMLVTLALGAKAAEAVVFGQEHGKVWLSLEPTGTNTGGTTVIDNGNVYTEGY